MDIQRLTADALRHLDDGRPHDALACVEQAFSQWRARHPHGMARFAEQGRPPQAALTEIVTATKRAADALAKDAPALERCGQLLFTAGAPGAACLTFERVARLTPKRASAHHNHAIALRASNAPADALRAFDRCLRRAPGWASAHNYRALCLRQLDRPREAREALNAALESDPDHALARFNRGLVTLYMGDFHAGWPDHEARWRTPSFQGNDLDTTVLPWRGEPVAGRRLLLWAEQGLGDTIQFARFAQLLAERGARVTLRVQPSLVRLLRAMTGPEGVHGTDEPLPAADAHAPLHSVPHRLDLGEAELSVATPYLAAEPAPVAAWRDELPGSGTQIGVIWRGGPSAEGDAHRSVPAEALWPLAAIQGVRLIALQKEHAAGDLDDPDAPPVVDPGPNFDAGADAFIDTAAIMTHLDLVVTCDTATAHLAGALGRPVWVALPWTPDWRWQWLRADSPWYPTMRLFRPSAPGDWDGVVRAMARQLASSVP